MIVVFFGSFYLINLVLAVVALSYEQEAENIANRVGIPISSLLHKQYNHHEQLELTITLEALFSP